MRHVSLQVSKPIFFVRINLPFFLFFPPGLKSGDEVLLLNGKPASALQMDDMRDAFVNQALTLSISTIPELDPQVLCSNPPRRSDWEQDPATDIFSQSQGEAFCCVEWITCVFKGSLLYLFLDLCCSLGCRWSSLAWLIIKKKNSKKKTAHLAPC